MNIELFPAFVLAFVVLSWFAFVITFAIRKKPPKSPDQKRDPTSISGIVIQGLSFALVWAVHRPYLTFIVRGNKILGIIAGLATMLLATASVVLTNSAVKALGKEWSLTARVIEGHKLATHGPYAWVRHPIYTGMLGMLISTGLAVSYWWALAIAVVLFLIGTVIRIRSEELLLRETFGVAFDEYAGRVRAIVPGIY